MANGSSSKPYNVMQAFVGGTVMVGLYAVIAAWMCIAIFGDPAKMDVGITTILTGLTGVVSTIAVMVAGYYFGSSKSSADKEETAKAATKAAADAATTTAQTLDKMVTGTGGGASPVPPIKPVAPPPKPTNERDQILEALGAKFTNGGHDEVTFREALRMLKYADADIDAAVAKYKPVTGGG